MYKLTRTCKVLPKVIMAIHPATTVVKLRCDISIWHRVQRDGSPTRLCTSHADDKHIPCSGKTLTNTKEDQLGYNHKAPLKYIYTANSSTDISDSDYCDGYEQLKYVSKARAMAEVEAQTQQEILAKYKEGDLYCYNPSIKYQPLKRYDVPRFAFSDDSSTDWSDSEFDTQNETMAEEEAQTQKDKIHAGTIEEPLSHYDLAKSQTSTDPQSVAEDLPPSLSTDPKSKPDGPNSCVELIETFEIFKLTGRTYVEKIEGLLDRFPKYVLDRRYRTVLWQKYPKTVDDYKSMKFCTIGRVPVYGIYNNRDLQLIAICVEGTLFAIDDCDLDPSLVPDLIYQKVFLNIRRSPLAGSQTLSYTEASMCSAVSILSLGYMPEKKDEWTDAFVLLMGMTTQAVRLYDMKSHIRSGVDIRGNAQHIPLTRDLRLQHLWSKVSKAIMSQEFPYIFKHYYDDGKLLLTEVVTQYLAGHLVTLLNDKDRGKGAKFWRRNDKGNGQRDESKRLTKVNYLSHVEPQSLHII